MPTPYEIQPVDDAARSLIAATFHAAPSLQPAQRYVAVAEATGHTVNTVRSVLGVPTIPDPAVCNCGGAGVYRDRYVTPSGSTAPTITRCVCAAVPA